MTKEELEKEAREYYRKNVKKIITDRNVWTSTENAYIAGAEPREKRITELEAQIEGKENEFQYFSNSFKIKITNLKAQIEKMKCCENCAWWYRLPNGQKDCAEFGYNKANEWHEDLPKEDVSLAIIEVEDCGYLLCEYRKGVWYDSGSSSVCKDWITRNIKRWKEIVLPELKESE